MSKKKKDSTPDYISKHEKMHKEADLLIDKISHSHSKAYNSAVDKHLTDEKGNVHYDRLDDVKVQKAFAKSMSDHYIAMSHQHFKVSKNLSELEKDLLMKAYSGTTSAALEGLVKQLGKNLTLQDFLGHAAEAYTKPLRESLYATSGKHIDESHLEGILKYVGLDKKVDAGKITAEQGSNLLRTFHKEGSVGFLQYNRQICLEFCL